MASEERREEATKDCVHRTKAIQFLGRTTPIILQNDNGPCPLLAICNVLLLKNNLNLSPDVAEVSQEKLLSLVAERLIDSNSNVNNKDAGYVENQQQNIADAIDLLPRLATGIDVNIKFRRIDDFEFTPECAIFDLLDIPLYHGWIVDPQDCGTTNVIGSKSYNAITGDLVALETRNVEGKCKNNPEEDSVDFAAATAATLGVPSPCLSRGRSFDESPRSGSDNQKERQGDMVDEAELLRALQLSEGDVPASLHDSCVDTNGGTTPVCLDESAYSKKSTSHDPVDTTEKHIGGEIESTTLISLDESAYYKKSTPLDLTERHTGDENNSFCPPESSISDACNTSINDQKDLTSFTTIPGEAVSSLLNTDEGYKINQSVPVDAGVSFLCNDVAENISAETLVQNDSGNHMSCSDVVEKASGGTSVQNESAPSPCLESDSAFMAENHLTISGGDEQVEDQSTTCTSNIHENSDNKSCFDTAGVSSVPIADSDSPSGESKCVPEALTSSVDDSEPMYEGEECIMDSGKTNYEGREPMYEGEAVLAERSDKPSLDGHDASVKDEINEEQGELIRNFLNNNASQLTIYGLFCLQEGLKERELCVFFRNNHFSTMFKFDGELYLLATDQGYINQPDLVWEKLNEVNGDSLFMTGNFKEFKIESHENETWNEQNAMASTADYLASIDKSAESGSSFNSDHLLAMALQQEEFEQQPQRHALPQPVPPGGSSRLVTGPQVNRNNGRNQAPPSKPESKSKEKCTVM